MGVYVQEQKSNEMTRPEDRKDMEGIQERSVKVDQRETR